MSIHRRSGETVRPRPSQESTRPRQSQLSPTSPTSPRVRFSHDEISQPTVKKAPSTRSNGARVIRTFEEIDKIVPKEEWYEELECGICSHILGAPQGLVPCGHSFCGPCAWTWIKVNGNHTCPHCRVPVNEDMPLIPNIVVDQIIDRKLAGLPDGKEKEGLISERDSKSGDWKVVQSSIVPPKPRPTPRRTGSRTLEVLNGFFDGGNNHGWGNSTRRNDHQQQPLDDDTVQNEEPNPRQRGVYAGMTLAAAVRRGVEDDQIRRSTGGRRLTLDSTPSQQSQGGYTVNINNTHHGPAGTRPGLGLVGRTSSNNQALEDHRQRRHESAIHNGQTTTTDPHHHRPHLSVRTSSYEGGVEPVSHVWNTPEARRSITRSRALATRQGRYRDSGSRDAPVLVESDHSEDD